jgi:hypothetical protein
MKCGTNTAVREWRQVKVSVLARSILEFIMSAQEDDAACFHVVQNATDTRHFVPCP